MSLARTWAPLASKRRAAATPLLPSPTTIALRPETFMANLTKLHGSQRNQGEKNGDDPKANDDFRFSPPFLFVVMVDGCHQEDPFAREFERDDLGDDADGLD